jgi:hypothetical protein
LRTDVSPDTAKRASAKLEDMFDALAELGFASDDRPKMSIGMVYFDRHEDYAALRPSATAGQFAPRGWHDYERRPTGVVGGDFVESTKTVLLHELTHLFVHYYYPQAPIWLNEGLARYFETLAVEDGNAVLGRAPNGSRFWKGPWRGVASPTGGTALIPMSEAPTAKELRAMRGDFYGDINADPTTPQGLRAMQLTGVHYQAAWCLVHLLLTDQAFAPAFRDYLGRLHAGEKETVAWRATVGDLGEDKIEAGYRAALVPREVTVLRTKFTPPAMAAPEIKPMTPSQVHTLFARLRSWKTPEGRAAAATDLEAAASDPDAEAIALRAAWAMEAGTPLAAEKIVRDALATKPHETELWNALGWILIDKGGTSAADLGVVAQNLSTEAKTAAEIDLLAHARALEGRTDDALAIEKRALGVDPNCTPCLFFTSEMLAGTGHYREAVDTVTLAMNLAPESRPSPEHLAQLATWKRHVSGVGGTPAPVPHADAVLAAMRGRFHPCLEGSGHPTGQVELDLRIDARGTVTDVIARDGATFAPPVVACLAGVVKTGHFPAPGADTTLTVPIRVGGP